MLHDPAGQLSYLLPKQGSLLLEYFPINLTLQTIVPPISAKMLPEAVLILDSRGMGVSYNLRATGLAGYMHAGEGVMMPAIEREGVESA